jgi:hypothetical protein
MAEPNVNVMRIGKYKGLELEAVPTDYLVWALKTFRKTPSWAMTELKRRAATQSGPSAILAQEALSSRTVMLAKKIQRRRVPKRSARRGSKAASRQEDRRRQSYRSVDRLRSGVLVVGEHYEHLRGDFLATDGDLNACPFDAEGYVYTGPSLPAPLHCPSSPGAPPTSTNPDVTAATHRHLH